MEMENRRRELERIRRRRKQEVRRQLAVCGAAGVILCLAAAGWLLWPKLPANGRETAAEAVSESAVVEIGGSENTPEAGVSGREESADAAGNGARDHEIRSGEAAAVIQTAPAEDLILPSNYDLREHGITPTVPDQGAFGTCWAFAALGAIETTMPEAMRIPLSADHMSIQNSFGVSQKDGGDYSISSAYLLAWQGPVAESSDPYGDGVSPANLDPVCHVQEIRILAKHDPDEVKQAVYQYGGVQSSFYMPQTAGAGRDRYYNEETHAFFYDGPLESNHDIVIIGWDDEYPRENFVKEPKADGAFLCMNTWGEYFGDRGYFYISYGDSRIGTSNVVYTGIEPTDNYDQVYQTDLCGWTGQLGYGTEEAWFANVYEAQETCFVEAAGFYATVPETSYKVYVVPAEGAGVFEGKSAERILEGRKAAAEGHVECAGFYTVPLAEQVQVAKGEAFAVIVQVESKDAREPVAVEYAAGERTKRVDISDGVGYISPDGRFWERAETELNCNVCLKAYVKNQ